MNTLVRNRQRDALRRLLQHGAVAACLGTLAACGSLPQSVSVDFPDPPPPKPIAAPASAPNATGSLYQKTTYRPAFEDPRARLVGDQITINIVEKVTASQKSSSTANRSSSNSASVSAFPLISPPDIANLNMGTESSQDFSGKGGTENANTFYGTITATVVDVLPNGHLLVAGDKQIGVNQNVDVLRFSGTIDPRVIQPGNVVNSTQVANARIESKGRGAQAEAQTTGWLTRFFFSFLPF
ncbi:flagellar basal body L-ring protein FlgH [Candidatus Symbiobacter mobilis]|uniref:Flagellar L-ring protein n=1 Tax=Candidatus Symbiobacter mobilis CR TaxID=946483 RepID=U5N7C5_9BURK|nr:flagellar basal body L-ring protein FlgH [Candidatus Symbiobacter mobilis]AGX87411.1 flagellar L-ring protein precursor FlgH [Candidatus Symbiobacter mobilis CR]